MQKQVLHFLFGSLILVSSVQADGLLSYKPPKSSSVPQSFGAGTRGINQNNFDLLAPKHTAFTQSTQPILYWYLSKLPKQPVQFVLVKEKTQETIFEKTLPPIEKIGLQRISLTDYAISLKPEEEYRWTIEVDGNVEGSATLKYVPASAPLKTVESLAQEGYWYDALQQLVETHSTRVNELLKQIDITTTLF